MPDRETAAEEAAEAKGTLRRLLEKNRKDRYDQRVKWDVADDLNDVVEAHDALAERVAALEAKNEVVRAAAEKAKARLEKIILPAGD